MVLSVPQNISQDPAAPVAAVNATYGRAAGAWRRHAEAAAFVGAIAGASAVGGLWQSFHHGETATARVVPVAMGTALNLMDGAGCQAADLENNGANLNVARQ